MSAKDSSSSSSSEDEHPTETQKTQEEHVEQKDSEKPQEEKKPEEHKESNAEKKDESQSNENQEQKNEEKPKKKKKKSEGAEGEKKKKKKKKSTSEGATEGAEGEKKKKKKSEKPAEGSGSPEAEKKESNDAKEAKPKKEKKEKKPEKSDSTEKAEKSPSSEKKESKEKETKEVKEAKPKKEKKEKEAKPTKQVSLPPQDNKTDEQRAEEENLRKSELEKGLVILDEYSEETKKIADQVREIENPPVQPAAHGKEKEPAHQIPKTRDIVKALFEGIRKHKTDAKLIQGSLLTARHLKDKEGIRHDVRAVEGLPLLVELLISDDVNIRRTSLRFIGDLITKNHSPDNVANGEAFLTAGGVPNVIKMMEDVEDIQIMAIGVVRVLAMFEGRSNAGFLEEIRANKGLSPLVPFLKSTSNDLIRQAASAIQYLCDGSRDNQAIFTDHDVVTILVDQIVVTLEEKVLVRLIDTFYSVLNNYEKAIKKAVSHKNLVEALGKLLQSGTIPQLKESVLRLFSVLAFHEDSVRVYARENGLLQYIIEQVIDEKNLAQEAVQRANVIALGALSQSGENMTLILESKVVDTLVAMTTNANDKVQAIGVLGLKPLVTISAEAQDKLIKSEGMQKLVPLLTSKNVESQENALEVLRQSRASVKSILVLQIPVLVELLASPSSNIREASITCIESLLTDENAINMLAREKKLVDRLAECMDGTREKLTVRACSTVDSLVTKGKLIDAIYKSYIPQKLSLLLPASNQKVKQHAVYALWAIANNSSKSQTLFAKLGCLKELLSLTVKDDSSSLLKEYAAGAVCSLVVAHSSNKKIFLAEGGVEKLTTLLTNESDGVKIYAAKALWAAAEETPAIQEASLNSLEGLLSMLKSKNPAVQASAASAVWSISEKNPKLQEAVREKGLIPWIVDIVNWHAKEYLTDPKTKLNEQSYLTAAVGAIAALTLKNVGNKEAFLDAGALNSIESLKDVPDRTLKKEVASCLLSLDSKARPRSGSIFQMVAAALKKDKSAENVKDKDSKKKEIKEIKSDEKSNDNANKEDKEDKPKDEEKKEDKPSEEKPKEEEKPKQEEKKDEEKKEDEKKEDEKKDDESSSSESSSSESSDAE